MPWLGSLNPLPLLQVSLPAWITGSEYILWRIRKDEGHIPVNIWAGGAIVGIMIAWDVAKTLGRASGCVRPSDSCGGNSLQIPAASILQSLRSLIASKPISLRRVSVGIKILGVGGSEATSSRTSPYTRSSTSTTSSSQKNAQSLSSPCLLF